MSYVARHECATGAMKVAGKSTAHSHAMKTMGLPVAFSILSAGSVGMIASPGGIGAYAYLIQKTMELYGIQEAASIAFGWLLWLVQTGVVVVAGLASFAGIATKRKEA